MKKISFILLVLTFYVKTFAQKNSTYQKNDSILEVIISVDRPLSAASSLYLNKLDFSNRPKNSAQDMLRLVPGLFIAQHAGGGKAEQIFIRGFDCDHGTDVASYVDGIPVNMPSHGHGQGYEDLHFLIPETTKDISVYKGPYQAQFGNFSTAATVEFKTLDSLSNNNLTFETTFTPTLKTLTANRILGMYQLPIKSSKFNSYFAFDGNYNRGYFERNQYFNRFNLFSKSVYKLNEFNSISLTVSTFSSKWDASGQIPERAVLDNRITRFGSYDPTEGGNTNRTNINLIYLRQKNNKEFSSQVYFSNYGFQLFSNFTFFLEDSINGDQIEQGDNRTILGWNTKFSHTHSLGSKKAKFQIGSTLRNDAIENSLWKTKTRVRLNPTAIADINEIAGSIYANESVFLTSKLKLDLGGRFDIINFNVEDKLPTDSTHTNYSGKNTQALFSPKLNLSYRLNEKNQLFINSGYGYHSNDARSTVQDLSNKVLPKSLGSEIGFLSHFKNKTTISAALWLLQLENELVYVGDDGTTENKGASRRVGVDFTLRSQLTKILLLDIDLNYSKSYFTTDFYGRKSISDFHIPLAPSLTSSGGLTYRKNKLYCSIRYRYISDRPANESNTVKAKGYFLLDASTSIQWTKIKCGISIENLLNSEWNEAQFDTESRLLGEQNSVSEIHFTPGTPFAIKFSVNYKF